MNITLRIWNAGRRLACSAMAAAALTPAAQAAQPPDIDKLVQYAQCIRANGYPEFPDPAPDGRIQLRLDRASGDRFETAQRACKDKVPPGLGGGDEAMTPERMQALLAFAGCVRGKGVQGFPDPSPSGVFEINSPTLDMTSPQVRQAVESCVQSHPPGALQIRRTMPR